MLTISWPAFNTERKLNVSERVPGTAGKVRLGITSGQDSTDRVRAVRRSRPEAAWREKTRDLHVPGLHPLLWATPQERNLHRRSDHCEKANGCEAQGHQGRASTPEASSHGRSRCM